MKNLTFYVIFVAAIFFFISCEKDNTDETSMQMTLTLQDAGAIWMSLSGSGLITVDFGDGTPASTYMLGSMSTEITYAYSNSVSRTITITGDNIVYLNCNSNNLTNLDVSENTSLTQLWCDKNKLTNLDISKNTLLTVLDCSSNRLTDLDVSKNAVLSEFYCQSNKLTSLNVRKNMMLARLYCYSNQLTDLDVSNNAVLSYLWCSSNRFSANVLNDIFNALPTYPQANYAGLIINDNPGSETCNRDIALNKGWRFDK